MNLLIDAQALIWCQDEPNRLGHSARIALQTPNQYLAVSAATIWEIGIKVAIGKLRLASSFRLWIETAVADLGLTIVPISVDAVERQNALPWFQCEQLKSW